ncbi:NAD-P-binding protein [Peniophora sp. CONT]|nr:NAD-P-binding protein [Peniophora sp. CONT]
MASESPRFPAGVRIQKDVYPAIDPAETFAKQSYAGKVVLVTGASGGLGAVASQFYARAGASVALVARNVDKLKVIIAGVPGAEARMIALSVDVKNIRAAEDAVKQTVEKFGKLDILIANAGVMTSYTQTILEKNPDVYWNTFEVNVKGADTLQGVFTFIRAALPELQKTNGQVVAVSAGLAYMNVPNNSDYAISKLAVNRLVEFIPIEFHSVSAYALHPGVVETNMTTTVELPASLPAMSEAYDTPELSAATILHLTLGKTGWLNGRYYSANWDIGDVEKLWKEKIVAENALVTQLAVPLWNLVAILPNH